MKVVPETERERLKALYEYQILDTLPEASYDFITSLAATICNTPVSMLSFFDANRQWYKSTNGIQLTETTINENLFAQAINTPGKVVVSEAPIVYDGKQVLFYAGAPVVNPEGHVLGMLSVCDFKVNTITQEQEQTLLSLAAQVAALLELRKTSLKLKQKETDLKMAFSDIENIAYIASHDLKTPVNNVISLAHLIKEQYADILGEEGTEYINFINDASYILSDMITGIHSYSKTARVPVDNAEKMVTTELVDEVISMLKIPAGCTFQKNISINEVIAPRAALKQILHHLLANAIQYNDKEQGSITIGISENAGGYLFEITDDGEGISESDHEQMFALFKRLRGRDKTGENMGMGLANVKCLVGKMHGTITVKSETGKGASFYFSIPKQSL